MSYTSTQKDSSTTVVSTALQIAHNKAVALQAQTKIDNAAQKAYSMALRAGGKVEAAAQMANPYSTQTFNTKQGTYVVEGRSTSNDNRAAAQQRTLDLALAENAKLKAEQEKKARANAMISTSNNSKQVANDFSDTSKYLVHNNNVNPASLYTPQPVNSNNNDPNNVITDNFISGGINTNANYNFATQMNDWLNANGNSQVNLGQSPQPYGYTAGLSSIPNDNEVKTSFLGGDIQHQETDVSTNLSSVNRSSISPDPIRVLGGSAGIIIGAAALFLLGRRK